MDFHYWYMAQITPVRKLKLITFMYFCLIDIYISACNAHVLFGTIFLCIFVTSLSLGKTLNKVRSVKILQKNIKIYIIIILPIFIYFLESFCYFFRTFLKHTPFGTVFKILLRTLLSHFLVHFLNTFENAWFHKCGPKCIFSFCSQICSHVCFEFN